MTESVFPNPQNLEIKLFVNGEVRRFVFVGTTFEELKAKCMKVSNFPENSKIILKYEDPDGDKITMSSDSEFKYAISLAKGPILRVTMVDSVKPEQSGQASFNISDPYYNNWRAHKEAHKMNKHWKHHRKEMKEMDIASPCGPPPMGGPMFPSPSGFGMGLPYPHHPPMYHHHGPYSDRMEWKKAKELDARFISHETYPDDTDVPAGTSFDKTWRFRNTGIAAWPQGTVFLRIDRANDLLAPDVTPVAPIEPNEETCVTVKMTCPLLPGRYQSYFKLCAPSGKKFGQRMRCQILSVGKQAISPERIDKVWEQLEAMGLVQKGIRNPNVSSIILRENCDVTRIVRELLGHQ